MKLGLVILEQVFEELNEAALYYNERQIDLGKDLLGEWDRALQLLQ